MTLTPHDHARVGVYHIETAITHLLEGYPREAFVPPQEIVERLGLSPIQKNYYTAGHFVSYVAQCLVDRGTVEYRKGSGYRLRQQPKGQLANSAWQGKRNRD